jgi:hypothetical protein
MIALSSVGLRRIFTVVPVVTILTTLLLASLSPASVRVAEAADPVLVGAGDIASCRNDDDEATAKLLDTIAGTVFTAGDNVDASGNTKEFTNCYDPTWGRHKGRTYPAAGNHDYSTAGAAGYFGYFGVRAGDPAKGYYSYDVGAWHVIVLNSNCEFIGCQPGSPQEQWLRADLAANPAACTLAVWHHPRFSSGAHSGDDFVAPFWQALYEAGADVIINGHDHHYERFAPQNPTGIADRNGIRQFIVGTGGNDLHPSGKRVANSQVREGATHGVIKFTLHTTSFDWEFVPVAGKTFRDSGTQTCVGNLTPPRNPHKAYMPLISRQ